MNNNLNVLVLGAYGMLGNAVFRVLSEKNPLGTYGSVRRGNDELMKKVTQHNNIINGVDIDNFDDVIKLFSLINPDVVINCIGLVKQLKNSKDPLSVIPINSIFPHRLASLCKLSQARLIHISTDCVFSGMAGMYLEGDFADANDLYGRSKLLGEITEGNAITLRTSIIGHELSGSNSLINWFLEQKGTIQGYRRAIFSGLPVYELAKVIRDIVIPNRELVGLYHVSSDPISKYELLKLVAKEYSKDIKILPSDILQIDRSLNSTKFKDVTGYSPNPWPQLIRDMHSFR